MQLVALWRRRECSFYLIRVRQPHCARACGGHVVETAYERGWSSLKNGELIAAAESAGFEVFVTTDKNLKYQQNFVGRSMAIVVLLTLYAKSKTDNLTGATLKEIRRVLEA